MSRREKDRSVQGSISSGDRVEVLSSEEGFSDAWATATCVGRCPNGAWQVEYAKFVDADGKALKEKVSSDEADKIIGQLEEVGAKVSKKPSA